MDNGKLSVDPAVKLSMRARHCVADFLFPAHTTDIFALATTPTALLSGSGSSTINIHRTSDPSGTFPIAQSLTGHKLGTHHIATSPRGSNGTVAASVGFGGDVKVWRCDPATGDFSLDFDISPAESKRKGGGDVWAIALDSQEKYLACTTHDGRIHVWDLELKSIVQTYETGRAGAGSFGLCVDLSPNGKLTATGHHNGSVYVFNNDVGHLKYSLSGMWWSLCPRLWTPHMETGSNRPQVLQSLSEQCLSLPATRASPQPVTQALSRFTTSRLASTLAY